MELILRRTDKNQDGIFGILLNGPNSLATLEHAFPDGDGGYTAKVAPGTYKCVRYDSPSHGYQVFVLEGVPDFQGKPVSYIEIHIGNYNKDSDGCILLGSERNGDMILDSKVTFQKFMDLMKDYDTITLTITD